MAITSLGANDTGATSRTVINDNFTDLDTTKADLASPTFTGTLTVPAIKITTGAGASKILTSDADGDATWETNTSAISVETTSGATHSLTTVANQKVIVWVKGYLTESSSNNTTITLSYNSVAKDTTVANENDSTNNLTHPFALMYTETPGAATADITVTTSQGSLSAVVIIVMKIG